ncbi:DUF397 domain-containing protein [Actinomadura terrae]|uniref:DUF397 domain-containing protein n=1 Tax=Actinomadura terrae TaxID=604353 RepID=UPI001FA6C7F8|nr:DUF397 domain-containing protein [Actinomadura terrae]
MTTWRKSSRSGTSGNQSDCVEVAALTWREASRSNTSGGDCVEVAPLSGTIGVRDSKDPQGPVLEFTPVEMAALFERVRAGLVAL